MLYRTRFEHEIASLLQYDVPPGGPAPNTRYLPIDLGAALKGNKVGAHVPAAAAAAKVVDVIVYFHGFIHVCGDLAKFREKGIEYLWSNPPFDNLRSELDSSGRAALLIAPQMHIRVGESWNNGHIGGLNGKNAFDRFLKKCCDELVARKGIRPDVKLGNIVLAAHSGGGWPMNEILRAKNDLGPKIRACWGFECLNAFLLETWARWLDSDASLVFRHYREKSTLRDSMKQQARWLGRRKHKNFHDSTTTTPDAHCILPRDFWYDAIGNMPLAAGSKDPF